MPHESETHTVGALPPPRQEEKQHLAPGSRIGERYEVIAVLGGGGHGVTYRVMDREVHQEIALKLLHTEARSAARLSRLRREVRVGRESASPRLVRVFDFGEAPQGTYLTMELVEGGSVRDRLREGPLGVPGVIAIAIQLFEGLEALHTRETIHRDVKPANILLTEAGEVKLTDFGLARRVLYDEIPATFGGIVGTPGYLAPEQALGDAATPRSDLYSAGLVIFEMLTGRLPQDAGSLSEERGAEEDAKLLGLRELRPEVPEWLANVVERLIARRPEARYPSASAVLDDLRGARFTRRAKRRGRLVFGGLVLVLLAAIGAIYLSYSRAPGRYSHLLVNDAHELLAISTKGEILWTRKGVHREVVYQSGLVRLAPNANPLLGIVVYPPEGWRPEHTQTLSFLTPETGEVLHRVRLPSAAGRFPSFANRFHPETFLAKDLDGDGVDEVLLTYIHMPEWPSFTVLYEPRLGRARVVFVGSGHHRVVAVEDLDRDGRAELIFAGINNRLGWYNVIAAVRITPWVGKGTGERAESATSPDAITNEVERAGLLWYALLPRGMLIEGPPGFRLDRPRRALAVRYGSGREVVLGYDGLPLASARSAPESRSLDASRSEAYRHLREAMRLAAGETFDAALAENILALEAARGAADLRLEECVRRFEARFLVGSGRVTEGERLFDELARQSENASEIAFDAGEALHLAGALASASEWYRRGTGSGGSGEAGKSKYTFLEGEVLALVEMRRYAEALDAIDRFSAAYPGIAETATFYREYVRWRQGEVPDSERLRVRPQSIDLYRYWKLEFEHARNADPRELLRQVEWELAPGSEVRPELLSLKAELLEQLGRREEIAEIARSALELARAESTRSVVARAHLDLLRERALAHIGQDARLPEEGGESNVPARRNIR